MKIYRILSGSFVADDGTTKVAGEELTVADDQVDRFRGQLEYLRDVELPVDPATSPSSAGPGAYGHDA